MRIHAYLLNAELKDKIRQLGLDMQVVDLTGNDGKASIDEIIKNLDQELKRKDLQSQPLRTGDGAKAPVTGGTRRKPGALFVLHEDERRTFVDVLATRLTIADGTARPLTVKGWLMDSQLYAELAGEDYAGSAEMVATTLVTKAAGAGRPAERAQRNFDVGKRVAGAQKPRSEGARLPGEAATTIGRDNVMERTCQS